MVVVTIYPLGWVLIIIVALIIFVCGFLYGLYTSQKIIKYEDENRFDFEKRKRISEKQRCDGKDD